MNKAILLTAVILLAVFTACASAQEAALDQPAAGEAGAEQSDKVRIETVNVPLEYTGSFNWETGEFTADVSQYEGAHIRIVYKDVTVTGLRVVYRQKENYLLVTGNVRVEQKDLTLACDRVEYYTDLEKMTGTGSVKASTGDMTTSSDEMIYLQKEDRVDFIGNVAAETKDANINGDRLIVLRAENTIRFNGWYEINLKKESESEAQPAE